MSALLWSISEMQHLHVTCGIFIWPNLLCSGWYDPLIQNQAYVDFATNAPGYGQLQSDRVIARLNDAFFRPGGCKDQEEACFAAGDGPTSNTICRTADAFCVSGGCNPVTRICVLTPDISRSIMSLSQQWAIGILTTCDRQPLLHFPQVFMSTSSGCHKLWLK